MLTDPATPVPSQTANPEIRVSIARQQLDLLSNGKTVKSWPVSTSKFGIGSEAGSFKTPTGRFSIARKIGAGEPAGMAFRSRVATGQIAPQGGDEDLILTRILWLQGLDAENGNTFDRYIYIHGTNQEELIGTPASHGCVRMRNADVADLFEIIPEGAHVNILF